MGLAVSMSGRARSLTFARFFARKSATAWILSCTSASTSELGSVSMTATLKSRSAFCRGGGSASLQPARVDLVGPRHDVEGDLEIVGAPRPWGPMTEMSPCATRPGRAWPRGGTMPQVGLWPYTPQ